MYKIYILHFFLSGTTIVRSFVQKQIMEEALWGSSNKHEETEGFVNTLGVTNNRTMIYSALLKEYMNQAPELSTKTPSTIVNLIWPDSFAKNRIQNNCVCQLEKGTFEVSLAEKGSLSPIITRSRQVVIKILSGFVCHTAVTRCSKTWSAPKLMIILICFEQETFHTYILSVYHYCIEFILKTQANFFSLKSYLHDSLVLRNHNTGW